MPLSRPLRAVGVTVPAPPDVAPPAAPVLPAVAAGDPAAVAECLARYGGLVWGMARRFLGNAADAEDATQDVFIDLWRSAARFDPARSSEVTFVAVVARRRLIDRRRKLARRPAAEPLPDSLPGRESDAARRADLADDVALAAAALARLREEPRRVVVLAVYHGLTHDEIARETGLPLGTVKTHIRRGLLAVRADLDAAAAAGGRK